MDGPAITVRGLAKRYGQRAVLDDVSFDVMRGEVFAILGPNGAGKTTAVEVLEGYRAPDGGAVRVLGLDPIRDGAALKPRIGIMLQGGGVYPQVTPSEALHLFASFFADPIAPQELLRTAGLQDVAGTRYRRLSGGEKQRLSLALALIGRPELVFLDEPSTAMDPQARRATWQLIRDLKQEGVTVVLTTHFMDEAEQLADRVAILDAGRIVALGSPRELAAAAGTAFRFRARPGLDVQHLSGALGGIRVTFDSGSSYAVHATATPPVIAALSAWMAGQDALISELHTGGGTLEEVYLRLTGQPGAEAA